MASIALRADRQDHVYERLQDLIIRGRLAPGVRVVESEIATRLGVSRTPVREAIQRLHQEGMLRATAVARRTELIVAPLTAADLNDLYRMMGGLESAAVVGVLELPAGERRAVATALRDAERVFENAARQTIVNYDRLFELHNAFHDTFVARGAAPRLRQLLDAVRPQVDRYEWVYAPLVGPDYDATFMEHREIVRWVREGDEERARRAVIANWERGADRLRSVIDRVGERGQW
jgi:DNA-binding GntR family transcriptional regulator